MKRVLFTHAMIVAAVVFVAFPRASCRAGVPGTISYQGKLTDDSNQLINGDHDMTFRLYDAASGGTQMWTESHSGVHIAQGLFNVTLGSTTGLTPVFQANDALYLEMTIGTETLAPRQEMGSAGYAMKAGITSREIAGGWSQADETWTYASATTFTVPGDRTAVYTKGARVKWTQSTVKYGVVQTSAYSSPDTTVTLIANDGYAVANAAVSANFYSYDVLPLG